MLTEISVAPLVEPISVAEAKAHLRVEIGDDDAYINTLITAARVYAENVTRRQFITATWLGYLNSFPSVIRMPFPPLQSATMTYVNTASAVVAVDVAVYTVNTTGTPGTIYESYGQVWPATRGFDKDIIITFKAGYGDAATSVPAPIRHAIKMLVSHWYEAREPVVTGTIVVSVPMTVHSALFPYRVWGF